MPTKVLNLLNARDMLSMRGFSRRTGFALETVKDGLKKKYFIAQMSGYDEETKRTTRGFMETYADEVKAAKPKHWINGTPIFTTQFIRALEKINARWQGKKVKW